LSVATGGYTNRMSGIGEMLDHAACRVSGHIWVVNSGIDNVMVCGRCGAQEDVPPAPARDDSGESDTPRESGDSDDGVDSLVPVHRPWLEPPFTAGEIF
jgi:hypothetical protein